ncbi:hypothetical protein LCGC14_1667340, partial [marine sediment metagenome]
MTDLVRTIRECVDADLRIVCITC